MKKLVAVLFVLTLMIPAFAQTTYVFDQPHTSANFRAFHVGTGYTYGRFDEYEGTLIYDSENVADGAFEFYINVESVNTNNDQRDNHLRSPDFFNAAQFPTIEFISTSISETDEENIFEVTGDLTIHGVTNEVTTMVEKTGENTNQQGSAIVGFLTEFTIDRTDYDMTNLLQAAGPMIDITFSFEGIAQD
jgi:polyisoprenoid-binding protein YceI